jgi:hypothetical protein
MAELFKRGIVALLLLGFYYNAYRYPLQINSSGTSPTYSDTPGWISLGKYLLVALVLAYLVVIRLSRRSPVVLRRPFHLLGYLFLAILPMVAAVLVRQPAYLTLGFFFLIPVILHTFSGTVIDFRAINRLLAVTVWVAIAVEVLQVALFLAIGRLPALAYTNSISVRFGSFLDDPNGFGLTLAWLIPFTAMYFRGWARVVALGMLGISLALTQSLTAVGTGFVMVLLLGALYVSENPRFLLPALAVSLLAIVMIVTVWFVYRREIIFLYGLYMYSKQGSLAAHYGAVDVLREVSLLNLMGIQPRVEKWVETGYVNLLLYFGLMYVATYVLLGAAAIVRYVRVYRSPEAGRDARCFAFAAIGLLIGTYLGNLTLPVISIFPLDLFTAVVLGLSSGGFVPLEGAAAFRTHRTDWSPNALRSGAL